MGLGACRGRLATGRRRQRGRPSLGVCRAAPYSYTTPTSHGNGVSFDHPRDARDHHHRSDDAAYGASTCGGHGGVACGPQSARLTPRGALRLPSLATRSGLERSSRHLARPLPRSIRAPSLAAAPHTPARAHTPFVILVSAPISFLIPPSALIFRKWEGVVVVGTCVLLEPRLSGPSTT